MTLLFYTYFLAQEWVNRSIKSTKDWWARLTEDQHQGADLSFAEELHDHQGLIDRTSDVPVEADAIADKEELVLALEAMEQLTIGQFSHVVGEALEKFKAGGEMAKVTDTGQMLMVKMEMSVWRNAQVDQIRSLGAEITEACRNS